MKKQLAKRLLRLSLLIITFGAASFSYSFFAPEHAEEIGDLSMQEAGELPAPGSKFYLISGSIFCVVGVATFFFASRCLKKV